MSTLPKIRVTSRGNLINIKADTLPYANKRLAVPEQQRKPKPKRVLKYAG